MDGFISHKKSSRQLMLGIRGNGNLKKKVEEVETKKKNCQKIWWWLH